MGMKKDIEENLKQFEITKINDQLANKDMNQPTCELRAILANISSTNGAGDHGHIGMTLDNTLPLS